MKPRRCLPPEPLATLLVRTCRRDLVLLPALLSCRSLRNPRIERVQREGVFKRLLDRCKRVRLCPRCGKGVRQRLGSVQCGCMVRLLALSGFAAPVCMAARVSYLELAKRDALMP